MIIIKANISGGLCWPYLALVYHILLPTRSLRYTCFTLSVCCHTDANGKWSLLLWTRWHLICLNGVTPPPHI